MNPTPAPTAHRIDGPADPRVAEVGAPAGRAQRSIRRTHRTVYERCAPSVAAVDAALASSVHRVFWADDLGSVPARRALESSRDADLTVVGGGYCGLWTAVLAKRRNPAARVVVLEAHTVGWAASGRNGGFCEASLTHGEQNGRSRWPVDYEELERLGMATLDAMEVDVAALGLECEFERTGSLTVAVEPHQVPWLAEAPPGVRLDRESVQAEIASPTFLAGRWDRDSCALVHPAKLAAELARVAQELGVEIYEHSPVVGLDRGRGPVVVRTERAVVRSERVALATNVYRSLLHRARLLTVPVYDYVLMTDPLDGAQRAAVGWVNRQGLSDMANKFHYARPTADGRILFGGYDAVYHRGGRVRPDYEDRAVSYRTLAAHFLTMFPQLEGLRFSHRWAGPIDTSTRFCAFHGLARGGRVAYAAGFTGLGVVATRFAAEVMLDRLEGRSTPRTGLEMVRRVPVPFPPEPVAGVGIALTCWSLDRADHREGRRNLLLRGLDALGLGFGS